MRHFFAIMVAFALTLGLVGCSGGTQEEGWTGEDAKAVLDSGAFTDELDELDCDVAWMVYGLERAGLEREQLTGGTIFRSAGATCEEAAVLIFDSEDSAGKAAPALASYVEGQIAENLDYRPQEIPKLDSALVEKKGATVLLVVAQDMDLVKAALEG